MNGAGRWRRWAVALVRHAASIMPGAHSPWAEAMRRELDYIGNDPAALRWALGCVMASYRIRMTHRPRWSAALAVRQVAAGGALILLIGVALQDRAGGQTPPPQPALDERSCDLPGASTDIRSNGTAARRNTGNADAGRPSSDCSNPMTKTPDMPSGK
jgi:hypothetical protein